MTGPNVSTTASLDRQKRSPLDIRIRELENGWLVRFSKINLGTLGDDSFGEMFVADVEDLGKEILRRQALLKMKGA